jgi:hypothetical protein
MKEQKPSGVRKLTRIGLGICTSGAIVAIIISQYRPGCVILRLDSTGTTHLAGVALSNTNLQRFVYGTIKTFGFKAEVAVPASWFTNINELGYRTNINLAYISLKRVGILPAVPSAHVIR